VAPGRVAADPILYAEPVDNWTVQVDGGHLGFVRADAVLHMTQPRTDRLNLPP